MVQENKIEVVRQTADRLDRSQSVVLIDYKGLNVAEMTQLRTELREAQSELKVVKNRLTRRALEASKCDSLDEMLVGPIALAFGYGEPSGPAKICSDFAKTHKCLEIKGGLLEKKRIDVGKIAQLAKLPSRAELLTQMASTILAPARQLVTAMNQAMAKIIYAMKERAEQLEA